MRRLAGLMMVVALVTGACAADNENEAQATIDAADPLTPPDVDTSQHSVPLSSIHFDTFDGRSVTLNASSPELRARLLDAIPPIDAPVYDEATGGDWLEPGDLVMGYVAGDQAYAYPFKILNFHEIVNDHIDDVPVLISYCPLCRSAIVYDRRVGEEVLSFGNTSALYESDMVMVDRQTGSYWWQVAGTAIVGPLTDASMTVLPSSVATWSDWKELHPETKILSRDTGFDRPYERDSFALYGEFLDRGQFAFPVDEDKLDDRLPASALVAGVQVDDRTAAYVLDGLTEPINDVFANRSVVVFPIDGGGAAFLAELGNDRIRFELKDGTITDIATGSTWSATGAAVAGPLQGTQLEPLPTRTTFWFALIAAIPDIDLRNPG